MVGRNIYVASLLVAALAGPVAAQQPAAPAEQGTIDVSKLPVDVGRIQRQLRQTTEREERDGLSLRFAIEVFGQAPPIVLFTERDNLRNGPVPYGGPTHRDMLQVTTPKEYRAPAADFSGLLRWLSDRSKK